jgi:hypothetical protein
MKITSLTALLASMLCAGIASAQADDQAGRPAAAFFLRAGAGYGLVHAGQTSVNGAAVNGSESLNGQTVSVERKSASFGAGLCATVAGGYMFTRHLGLELAAQAVIAPRKYAYSGPVPGFGNTRTFTSEMYAKLPVYLIPAILLQTGNKLQLYGRAGLVLPISDRLTNKETRSGTGPGQTTQVFTRELENRFSIGLQGAGGLSYPLTGKLSVWGEVNAISRNAYARRSELTAYTEDGLDGLSTFTTTQRIVEYEFSYEVTEPVPASQPDKQPAFSVPFGSIGLSLGLKYAF